MVLPRLFIVVVIALVALAAQVASGSSLRRLDVAEPKSFPRRMEAQEFMEAMANPNLYCYAEQDFDFTGYDIGNSKESSAGTCCGVCYSTPNCKAYSWSSYEGGTCWLKSQRGPVVYKQGVQSALLFLTAQQTCTLENGVDYVDNDLARVNGANAGACCDLCKAYSGCRAFSWTNYQGGSCWLKSAKGTTAANANVQSAEVYPSPQVVDPTCNNLQYGVDFYGNDIGNAASPTPAGCCAICKNWNGCRSFSWTNQSGGTCWLKNLTGAQTPNPNVISAVVVANPPPTCVIENGVDYFDNDIGNAPSATAEGCCEKCKSFNGCKAFSWTNQNGGTCWLKSAKGTAVANANVKSAVI
ncbi:hypothetical protein Gpo141_00009577 [Globisporangium polare]